MGLWKYILKKLIFALVTYFVAVTLVFFIYHVMPGDPTYIYSGNVHIDEDIPDSTRERWGLNEPLWKQYFIFLRNILQGDLGYSFFKQKPVMEVIGETLPWTLLLLGSAFVINGVLGILLGSLVAWKRGSKVDTAFVLTYNVYNAFPLFFVGMIFIALFGFYFKIWGFPIYFPLLGAQNALSYRFTFIQQVGDILWHLALPLSVLVISGVLGWSWFMRGNLINVKTEDYIQTARAKGLSENQVLFKHGFRNALLPVITSIGMSVGGLIGGSVLIESVFNYPGTGLLLLNALLSNDYNLVQGAFIIIAGLTLFGLLIAEILYGFIDPRIRNA
ncbi:MAG: ABC transporter permease [Candidatus Heimdallarchaeota archaeon]|nr:ABC transporter permease [Candidatus Heimdallarchaeota archaeon]